MNKCINFEDNIFILNNRIRVVQNTIILDADPDLFLEKTIDDLNFIDTNLGILLDNLSRNDKLIERNAQFYNLMETDILFTGVLHEISRGEGSISVSQYPVIHDKIQNFLVHSRERQYAIQDSINSAKDNSQDSTIVSSDELNELLRSF